MGKTANKITVTIAQEAGGQRLDRALVDGIDSSAQPLAPSPLSRSRVQQLIKQGMVETEGRAVLDPNHKARVGEIYVITLPPPEAAEPEAQEIPLEIVYEDKDLLVINKPAGMVVHPAAGNWDKTLVNALLAHCGGSLSGIGGVARPGIVHRLDKDTSGLMVVAKNDVAHQGLTRQFAEKSEIMALGKPPHPGSSPGQALASPQGGRGRASPRGESGEKTISRVYQALVWGLPNPIAGDVEGNIGRHPRDRQKMAVVARGGKPALTHYRVMKCFGGEVEREGSRRSSLQTTGCLASLVECRLATGRTHQIRVHMAHIKHPVVGDQVYGHKRRHGAGAKGQGVAGVLEAFPRQALHAAEIRFVHPRMGKVMHFKVGLPEDMARLIKGLEVKR